MTGSTMQWSGTLCHALLLREKCYIVWYSYKGGGLEGDCFRFYRIGGRRFLVVFLGSRTSVYKYAKTDPNARTPKGSPNQITYSKQGLLEEVWNSVPKRIENMTVWTPVRRDPVQTRAQFIFVLRWSPKSLPEIIQTGSQKNINNK
jgi:hypothetical protein